MKALLIILSIHLFRWSYFKQAEFAGKNQQTGIYTTAQNLYWLKKAPVRIEIANSRF